MTSWLVLLTILSPFVILLIAVREITRAPYLRALKRMVEQERARGLVIEQQASIMKELREGRMQIDEIPEGALRPIERLYLDADLNKI